MRRSQLGRFDIGMDTRDLLGEISPGLLVNPRLADPAGGGQLASQPASQRMLLSPPGHHFPFLGSRDIVRAGGGFSGRVRGRRGRA